MTAIAILKKTLPYVLRYKWIVAATLLLTLVGSLGAQVNAIVLNFTVDRINDLTIAGKAMREGASVLLVISLILLGKELVAVIVTYGQRYYGEKIKINISHYLDDDSFR